MTAEESIPRPERAIRPRIISALAILWLVGVGLFPVLGLREQAKSGALPPASLPLAIVSALLAYGLWTGRPWARILQMVVLVPMMCVLPLAFGVMILLGYLGRPETRRYFLSSGAGPSWCEPAQKWSQSEWPWVVGVLAGLMIGALLLVAAAPLFRAWG